MVDYVAETKGNVCLPGVMALGYIAAHSETLAMAVIVSKVRCIHVQTFLQYIRMYMHICVCACCVHVCTRLSISKTARVWHATLVHIAVCVHICMYVCTYVCMPPPHVLQ